MTFIFPTKSAEPQKKVSLASAFTQGLLAPTNGFHPEASAGAAEMLRPYSRPEGAGIEAIVANIAALAQAQQDAISLNASVEDWDLMFRAVEDRLSSAVGKVLVATPGLEPQTAAVLVQTIVLECVTALGQLHEALTQERGKRHQLEQETERAQAALAGGLVHSSPPKAGNGGLVS